jgi:hypothetical protein
VLSALVNINTLLAVVACGVARDDHWGINILAVRSEVGTNRGLIVGTGGEMARLGLIEPLPSVLRSFLMRRCRLSVNKLLLNSKRRRDDATAALSRG